jgi:hypothetical protein
MYQGNSNRMAHAPFHALTLDISCIGEDAVCVLCTMTYWNPDHQISGTGTYIQTYSMNHIVCIHLPFFYPQAK